MNYTISDLFKTMHYCNKCVKWENFENEQEKKRFYKIKRDIVYYIIRNHKELGVTIDDCHIDLQPSNITNGNVKLYAFCLTYGDTVFKVHQKEYSKLTQLFNILNIDFSEVGTYELKMDDTLSFSMEEFANAMDIVSEFYNKWKLNSLIFNLNDPNAHVEDVYESFVFFFPDFKFKLEMKGSTMGKNTIVNVIHRKTGRSYRLPMHALKTHGEKPICFMTYNQNGYESHCRKYKEYQEWVEKRNPIRYESNLKSNYDCKNVMHCVRLLHMGKELAEGQGFNVVRTWDRDFLLDIRNHKYEYEYIMDYVEKLFDDMQEKIKSCSLPETVDRNKVNELLIQARKLV